MNKMCIYCGEEIHPMRLDVLPNTKTCVKCSKEAPKGGRLVTFGTGEEIYTEVEVLDRDTLNTIYRMEKGIKSDFNLPDDDSNHEEDDSDYSSSSEYEDGK